MISTKKQTRKTDLVKKIQTKELPILTENNNHLKRSTIKEPVYKIKIGKCNVTILGTAHVSQNSIDEVISIIKKTKPDTVGVELCDARLAAIRDDAYWKKLDIFKVFKERKMYLLLSSLILSSFQKKMGHGKIRPGDEMRAAIANGEANGARIAVIDRDIQTTLKRAWSDVGFMSRMYLFSALITSLFVKEEVTPEKIEEMKSEDVLKDLFSGLPPRYNNIKRVIIDERDEYLAQKIRKEAINSKKLFAVVGAGHLQGIMKHIQDHSDIAHLDEIPVKTVLQKLSFFIFPALILLLFSAVFFLTGKENMTSLLINWVVVKSSLAALGALIALAHPFSILLAALAAPIGNFNPVLKPGWIAALSESWLRKPLVEDFEKISEDTEHFTGFWKNRVIRIFMVFILPQVGSSIGTLVVSWHGVGAVIKGISGFFS